MNYLTAVLAVLLAALAAGAASWISGRFLTIEARRRRHEVAFTVFGQLGLMISVLLAFVFSEVWDEYRTAAASIDGECGALHGAAMLAAALPGGVGAPVEKAIGDYVRTVVTVEWPMMAHRKISPEATEGIRRALTEAARINVAGPAQAATQGQILSLLAQAHAERETRTFELTQAAPAFLWFVVIVLSLILILFIVLAGIENPAHLILGAGYAASIVLVLVLVRMLDYPFEGALALGDADFVKTPPLCSTPSNLPPTPAVLASPSFGSWPTSCAPRPSTRSPSTGGHLGAGLGVVELTVALHHVFETPRDILIWDVGHQAYPHKILTGRRDRIRTLRQGGGLSGFTKRAESEYDPFGAAHAATSISAALGFCVARDMRGRRQQGDRGDRRRLDERGHGL